MGKKKYLRLLLSLCITSCLLSPNPKEQTKVLYGIKNMRGESDYAEKIKVDFKTGSERVIFLTVGFLKTAPLQTLKDINNNAVLDGVAYSFVLGPTEFAGSKDAFVNQGLAKTLALEVRNDRDQQIKIKDFYFVNRDGSAIDLKFSKSSSLGIPHSKNSQEPGYKTSYNRGVFNDARMDDLLGKTINAHYESSQKAWKYMYLKIVLEKAFEGKREYIVKINPYIFNELVKEFRKTHTQDLAKGKNKLPHLPVEDN